MHDPVRLFLRAQRVRRSYPELACYIRGPVNIGSGKGGGAITGAMFIKEFTGDTPWIHLDIAGTAWNDDQKPWMAKGATGTAVRTLVHLLMSY